MICPVIHGQFTPLIFALNPKIPSEESGKINPPSGQNSGFIHGQNKVRINNAETFRPATRCYRLSWSAFLARIFSVDACQCECGGRMKIVAAVTDPASVRRYLKGVGLPADPPLIAPARASPQLDFDW
jgi:hypothetical protein